MNCDEVRDLLPAYVLGALDADELTAVEEHIRAGREHDDELVELRATVFALDRFGAELDLDTRVEQEPISSQAAATLPRERLALWPAAAAAVLVLAVFGLGWLVSDLTGDSDNSISIAVQASEGRELLLDGAGNSATVNVTMAGFEKLDEGQQYQVWAIREGTWLRIGVCNTNVDGWWHGDFDFTIRPAEQVAVTIEPEGGSPTPTSEPILITSS